MTFLRRFSFILILLLCAGFVHAQRQLPNVKTITPTFTTIDVPGAGYTAALGINTAGDIVGDYGQSTSVDAHGFKYSSSAFTYFDYPDSQGFTIPLGLNDAGIIVGYGGRSPVEGFLYNGTDFTTLRDGNDSATFARGINNAGMIVGGAGTIYVTTGFVMLNGRYRQLLVPGTHTYVFAEDINNVGEIVGDADQDAFMCHRGGCSIMSFPGASQTAAIGVNDNGVVVGSYGIPSGCLECAFAWKNGKYVSFSYPGAAGTAAYGINKSGLVVGAYTFDFSTYHGFVTSPITAPDFK